MQANLILVSQPCRGFYVGGRSFYICTPINANPILPIQAARVVIKWGFNKAKMLPAGILLLPVNPLSLDTK